jgi:hypothetical protein
VFARPFCAFIHPELVQRLSAPEIDAKAEPRQAFDNSLGKPVMIINKQVAHAASLINPEARLAIEREKRHGGFNLPVIRLWPRIVSITSF